MRAVNSALPKARPRFSVEAADVVRQVVEDREVVLDDDDEVVDGQQGADDLL